MKKEDGRKKKVGSLEDEFPAGCVLLPRPDRGTCAIE